MARYQARKDDVAWRIVDGEAVLVHADTSAYFGLNRTGTLLWEALVDGARSRGELLGALGVPDESNSQGVVRALDSFLADLLRGELAEEVLDGEASGIVPAVAAAPLLEPPQLLPFGELEQLILSGE